MDSLKIVAIQRKRIIKDLLPDTCQIRPKTGTGRTIDGAGILHDTPAALRQYAGSTTIPCRIDLSRAFRPDKLKVQATEIDEYNLELPFDMVVEPTDRVTIGIEVFEIRKKKDLSLFDATIELVIAVIGAHTDADA